METDLLPGGVEWVGDDTSDDVVRDNEGVRVREMGFRNETLRYLSYGDGYNERTGLASVR